MSIIRSRGYAQEFALEDRSNLEDVMVELLGGPLGEGVVPMSDVDSRFLGRELDVNCSEVRIVTFHREERGGLLVSGSSLVEKGEANVVRFS